MIDLYEEFFKLVAQLNAVGVDYAVVGGIAMAFHAEPRFTRDIDILIPADALSSVAPTMNALDYEATSTPWTFSGTPITRHRFARASGDDYLSVDFLVSDWPAIRQMIDDAVLAESDRGRVKIVRKNDLIALKRLRNSAQDQADIDRLRDDPD